METYFAVEPDFTYFISRLNVKYHNRYLLNLDKEYYDILEKFVFDTAVFHFNHHTEDSSNNINDYFIEFWIKNTPLLNNIHIDCDEDEKEMNENIVYPNKSIITYLNDHLYPTLFTNIDGKNIPNVVELTYVRKDIIQDSVLNKLPVKRISESYFIRAELSTELSVEYNFSFQDLL
jgi:hypothetical protein